MFAKIVLVNIDGPSGELTGNVQALGMRLQRILFQGLGWGRLTKGNYELDVQLFRGLEIEDQNNNLYYLSNRPQVSMGYKLINHTGCW